MAKKEPTYDEAQIAEKLKELPGWYLEDGWIRRVYKTDGWPTTLMLVNAIGYLVGGGVSPSRSVGDVGARHGEAVDAQRRRHHRQGLRAGAQDRGRRAVAAGGRRARSRARRTSSCGAAIRADDVDAGRPAPTADATLRVASCSSPASSPSRRCGACSPRWRRRSRYDVAVLKITVAALMTTAWIARIAGRCRRAPTSC